jgi:hypothetical protein
MSFRPNLVGYSPATNQQTAGGSAPFVYNHKPGDSLICAINKASYNNAHSAVFSPDTIVRSHPASALIQGSALKMHENAISKTCLPSFKHDGLPATAADKYFNPWFA